MYMSSTKDDESMSMTSSDDSVSDSCSSIDVSDLEDLEYYEPRKDLQFANSALSSQFNIKKAEPTEEDTI